MHRRNSRFLVALAITLASLFVHGGQASAQFQAVGLSASPCGGSGSASNDTNNYYGPWWAGADTMHNGAYCILYVQMSGASCRYCADYKWSNEVSSTSPNNAHVDSLYFYGTASHHRFCLIYNCGPYQSVGFIPTAYS